MGEWQECALSTPGRHEAKRVPANAAGRSEEHTSELQSRSDLVCRLLLEKKKTRTIDRKQQMSSAFRKRRAYFGPEATMNDLIVVRLEDTDVVKFGANATYQPIIVDADGSTPLRTGIQTSQPGYVAPVHSHPYMEVLHIL